MNMFKTIKTVFFLWWIEKRTKLNACERANQWLNTINKERKQNKKWSYTWTLKQKIPIKAINSSTHQSINERKPSNIIFICQQFHAYKQTFYLCPPNYMLTFEAFKCGKQSCAYFFTTVFMYISKLNKCTGDHYNAQSRICNHPLN